MKKTNYTYRFLARFVIEAKTPLAVGSGEKDITTDALVATDVNGLPYIPGTAIAGVVRSMIGEESAKTFFGYQVPNKKEDGKGSEIIFTEAKILNSKGEVVDGLNIEAIDKDPLLKEYKELPIRQHARISEKGVTVKGGKFDEQVVFAGTRFCFELEMVSVKEKNSDFESVLSQINNKTFRIGGGTRCGFGEIEVVEMQRAKLDLSKPEDLDLYLDKSSNLSEDWNGWQRDENIEKETLSSDWVEYKLSLQPEDFFLFGSGFGDSEVDMTPVKARKVVWEDGVGRLSDKMVLIPATSVKGALSHRVAFHWNKLNGYYAGNPEAKVGKDNFAVKTLFGSEGEKDGEGQLRGNVIFSDIIEKRNVEDKILNHVAIDRFTGGAIDGALFSEKTTYVKEKDKPFEMTLLVKNEMLSKKDKKNVTVGDALEVALQDICKGMLPLGGGVNRGNGIFTGTLKRGEEIIYPKDGGQ
jgi:CRISPR/Cas system CSM-associated protein Csm3 (group 7 of RAMP superfamily)